jgi:uncharacterized membrane protein
MSVFGLYLMSGCAEVSVCIGGAFGNGEMYIFVSMWFWVISIICSDVAAKKVDPIDLTLINFITATVCSVIFALIVEPNMWDLTFHMFTREWLVLLLVGLFQAAGFVLCTIGQRYTPAATSALLMSLDAVVCAAVGYVVLGETLSLVEVGGCVLMLVATTVALVPFRFQCADGKCSVAIAKDDEVGAAGKEYLRLPMTDSDAELSSLGGLESGTSNTSSSGGGGGGGGLSRQNSKIGGNGNTLFAAGGSPVRPAEIDMVAQQQEEAKANRTVSFRGPT